MVKRLAPVEGATADCVCLRLGRFELKCKIPSQLLRAYAAVAVAPG